MKLIRFPGVDGVMARSDSGATDAAASAKRSVLARSGAQGPAALALVLAMLGAVAPAHAHRAHVHGAAELSVAVDSHTITVALTAPLDSLVGFERAPRTDAEKAKVEQVLGRLRDGERMFPIDAAAGCSVAQVTLESSALGLGGSVSAQAGHAELDAIYEFRCTEGGKARFVEAAVIREFPALQSVSAAVDVRGRQFKRKLSRTATRLTWNP